MQMWTWPKVRAGIALRFQRFQPALCAFHDVSPLLFFFLFPINIRASSGIATMFPMFPCIGEFILYKADCLPVCAGKLESSVCQTVNLQPLAVQHSNEFQQAPS